MKAFEKRDGSGSYNWGTAQDELAASEEQQQGGFGTPKEINDTPAEDSQEVHEEGAASGNDDSENKENIEAEAQQITFEEYKKQQEEKRSKPQFNLRKANEGEKLKGMKQLKKPTEEDNEADGDLFFPKRYYEERFKTSGRVKEQLNWEFKPGSSDNRHLDSSRNRRGARGGKPSGRRDDAMGGGFGNKQQLQLENAEEFPSL